ncbi:AAA family ATPase [Clostridium sp. MSJ-8]|uniref:AAA family ATPase n=1 Tax=Clostridium sp. MSJ-8 TaxID=2841510 RepID=UPI001C0EF9C2|nr:AAA family ATPase [Clostridium sp. MSJ-8]MBU5486998.1 AAA family ATPase [Clostridium sp. MSJ-8]
MRYSHSRVECHNNCPYQYKLRYVDHIKTISAPESNDALICGNTIHKGAETNLKTAIEFYYSNYPIINDNHINEVIKFEHLIPKIHEILADVNVYKKEFKVNTPRFIGIVDLITKNDDGSVDVFDYKYSNNYEHYNQSPQLHLYKYFLEQIGFKVRKLGFIFIPKISIRQKQEENLYQFRRRLTEELKNSKIKIMEVQYNAEKVAKWMNDIINITEDDEFKKNPTNLCGWCEYQEYCLKGEDYMLLPKNERREKKIDKNPDLWIYAQSYVGKSTFIDQYDDLLFLNTDGNTDNTTSPVIPIKDEITVTGRITNKKFAWEVFKEAISELEKKDNDFKRVALDLIEDLWEHCRLYMYDKNGWEHESDGGYGKGWDMIRTEFLSTMKRLKALGYQIIYISKEVATEVTFKNGTKYTTYKPNINDKVANVLAGTVDLTVRAYVDGDKRYIQLSKDENVFGGGRFNFTEKKCELHMEDFTRALVEAQQLVGNVTDKVDESKPEKTSRRSRNKVEEPKEATNEPQTDDVQAPVEENQEDDEEKSKDEKPVEPKEEEKPRTRRTRRSAREE